MVDVRSPDVGAFVRFVAVVTVGIVAPVCVTGESVTVFTTVATGPDRTYVTAEITALMRM
jgi:hypothetical protein